jgi:calcium/calmodulin-dependent protein kinase I
MGDTSVKRIFNKLAGQPELYARKLHFTFGRTLGAGLFGIVRYARDNDTNEEVAVKILLKKALKGNEQMVLDELHLLQDLHHPHIVGFRDWFELKDKFYLVTQLATGGELFDRIIQRGRFTEHDALLVVVQILEALQYLHDTKNVVHRDLKPENILYLTPDPQLNVVLADFGIAKRLLSASEKLHLLAGSFGYAAPEVIMGTGHGKPCDVWLLGVITYTLLCGYSPFRSETVQDFIQEVKHNNAVIFHADYWRDVLKDARRFIIKALQLDPEQRPTALQLLEDPWLVLVAAAHKEADLLPNLKPRFDARGKFRQAIEMVKLNNRIKRLKAIQTDDDDDPNEINLFGDEGVVSGTQITRLAKIAEAKPKSSPFNWKALTHQLDEMDDRLRASLSPPADAAELDPTATNPLAPVKRSSAATAAFVQLVQAARQNKERVQTYGEKEEEQKHPE